MVLSRTLNTVLFRIVRLSHGLSYPEPNNVSHEIQACLDLKL